MLVEQPSWRLKKKWKFRAYCPECGKVVLFRKSGYGRIWECPKGHEFDWDRVR